ncbi:ABC transporter ATP-binding protein [Oceanobacillus sp. CAU 1775]
MLKLNDLHVKLGSSEILNDINIEIAEGELIVLLGANGAGKSTIFNTISGFHKPSKGSITFENKELKGASPDKIVKKGIVQCAEGRKLFHEMTVHENLRLGGYIHRRKKSQLNQSLAEVYALFPILEEKKREPAGSLSGGQQQMLAIGRALMAKPKLILMDEPSIGLAPLIVDQMFSIIKEINQSGTTVLLAEQNANAALKIANRGYVIENGKITLHGTTEALLADDVIRKAYIGA